MRWSQAFIPTLKEDPQDAEVISHKLMVRGGFIRKLISGAYSYLPLGVRVLEKVKNIIREELNSRGAQEVLLPAIHPPELWKKTGRYEIIGPVMIKFKDRHGKELVLGPTHEEIITDLVANNIKSYKDLPITLYQIQTKFRDEPRPRFGVMRTSEFIMKDAYSFDCDVEGLEKSYKNMYEAYCKIFERCGLPYIPVEADPGMMGGNVSHEFMVPTDAGEDRIAICSSCKYAASTEVARCMTEHSVKAMDKKLDIKEVATPGLKTIEKVSEFLKVSPKKLVKTIIYKADGASIAILIRGDFEVNETKLKNYLKCNLLELADEKTIKDLTGSEMGFSGPVGLKGARIIADHSVKDLINFVAGANKKDTHLINVNIERDFTVKEFGDFRTITSEDKCPLCGGKIDIKNAIEIGHTFKLGTKYSEVLGAKFLDSKGVTKPAIMGCYGIGVNRIAASLIETSSDKDGIIWPISIAPYSVIIIALNMENEKIREVSDKVYDLLSKSGCDVLYDDRAESAGKKFKDADLIGIPIKVIVGDRNAKNDKVEVKMRKTGKIEEVPASQIADYINKVV